ncbi:MAG TPA: HEPN domain-containing protein [Pirellulales bacterium]|nr:HEPN domain-containing protein [Pirellulales bacterium]
MDPIEFIEVAEQLLDDGNEPRLRSAVSRAYYGAFHAARRFLQDCGVQVPKSDVHDKLRWCLQESGSSELETCSRRLDTLRAERNKADYDLGDPKFKKLSPTRLQVRESRVIVATINSMSADTQFSVVRDRLRDYAVNVLRWRVGS